MRGPSAVHNRDPRRKSWAYALSREFHDFRINFQYVTPVQPTGITRLDFRVESNSQDQTDRSPSVLGASAFGLVLSAPGATVFSSASRR